MRKVILIDDQHATGWSEVLRLMMKEVFNELVIFETLETIDNDSIEKCYEDNPDAVFIQDNRLGKDVHNGLYWLRLYSDIRCIIIHTADDIAFEAGVGGAVHYMKKDDPASPMNETLIRKMIIDLYKTIIKHFKLTPELMWIVYNKMGWSESE